MAKVKSFCQNCGAQYAKCKGNVTPVKNGQLQKKLSKRRKGGLKSESASKSSPKAFKINEIDSTQEVRMDTTDSELNRVLGGGIVPGP
jgi:DNA repair protein RadA/Sms